MTGKDILQAYESISVITDQMLQAALNNNWELLVRLEKNCMAQAKRITETSDHVMLADPERQEKIRIINKILSDDRQIRALIEPRMNVLSDLMRSSRSQRQINKLYQLEGPAR